MGNRQSEQGTAVKMSAYITRMYLSIQTLKTIIFHLLQFKNQWFLSVSIFYLCIGSAKTMNFPFVPNGKLMISGAPIFMHIIDNQKSRQCRSGQSEEMSMLSGVLPVCTCHKVSYHMTTVTL